MTYNSILYISICAFVYGLLKKKKPENNRVKIKIKIKGKPEDIKKIGINKEFSKNLNFNSNSNNMSDYNQLDNDIKKIKYINHINDNASLKATFDTLSHEEKLKLIDPSIWG